MVLDEQRINAIVQRVVSNLRQEAPVVGDAPPARAPLAPLPLVPAKPSRNGHVPPATGDYGVFPDVDAAVAAAQVAQKRLIAMSMEKRQEIIGAMRTVAIENAEVLARMAAEETGMGRWEDKLQKNLLVARKTPGPEVLRPEAWSGDKGLTLVEWADRVEVCMPRDRIEIHIEVSGETTREFQVIAVGRGFDAVLEEVCSRLRE